MAYLIKLPSVAADTSGGTLHQWLKKEGDTVAVGGRWRKSKPKAIVEINAEQAGVLGRIVVLAGAASVPVNTVIGVLLAPGEDASAIDRALAESGAAPSTPRPLRRPRARPLRPPRRKRPRPLPPRTPPSLAAACSPARWPRRLARNGTWTCWA